MSSDLVSILEKDPVLLAQLAAGPGEPRSLAEFTARALVKEQANEAARQLRRRQEAERWQHYQDERRRRAMAPPAIAERSAPGGSPGVTRAEVIGLLYELAEGLAPPIVKHVRDSMAPLRGDITRLEDSQFAARQSVTMLARCVEELDAVAMKYRGVWAEGKVYELGDVATHGGLLWFSESDGNTDRPGHGKTKWKMTHTHKSPR